MAGVVGSTNITGTSYSLSASSPHFLNPVDTQAFATGDVVTDIDVYVFGSPTADTIFKVSLWALNAGAANGATLVWEKEVTIPNGTTGSAWYNIPVSNEAISASNGATLAVATSSRTAGSGMTLRQGATGSARSNAASGSTFVSPWVETTTTDRQLAVTVTTAAGSSGVTGDLAATESGSDVFEATGGLASNGIRLTLRDTDTGALFASETGLIVSVRGTARGAEVAGSDSESTDSNGVLELASSSIVVGTDYRVFVEDPGGNVAGYLVQGIDLNA